MNNREIKFRVWDKNNKKFVKWWLSLMDGDYELNDLFTLFKDRFQIQQFTGLTDKNGHDIYEGDIVKTEGRMSGPFVIEYHAPLFTLTVIVPHSVPSIPMDIGWELVSTVEVIGNIFENPQLLNAKSI